MEPTTIDRSPADQASRRPAGFVPRWSIIASAAILAVAGIGSIVRVPYHSLGPGPADDVLTLINVSGTSTHPSRGKLLLTTARVSGSPLNMWELLYVWVRSDLTATPRHTIIQPGFSDERQDAENAYAMEESKLSAERAAFRLLGLPVARVRGARVVSVVEGAPADGTLRPGDTIVEVDGQDVLDVTSAARRLRARAVGEDVEVTFLRGGRRRAATLTTRATISDPSIPSIGVFLGAAYRLPHQVEIDTQRIGGPSGGLVFALAIVDVLTPDDLTRGHIVAATGTIIVDEDGTARVGVIGAVGEKVRAAAREDATVFLVPAEEEQEAAAAAPEGMRVIGVATLQEAVEALRALPEADAA